MIRATLRHPLLHFLVLGFLLYALDVSRAPSPEPIVFSANDVAALRAAWHRETGRVPDTAQLQASLRRHADEEMLVREALRRGLDARDPVVRERLLSNVAFAFPDPGVRPAEALRLARELGMAHRDLVTRRRLVQLMEAALATDPAAYPASTPSRAAHGAIERRGIQQLWFQGAGGQDRAAAALADLQVGDARAEPAGDPFLLGARFAPLSEAQLAQRFGARFARAAMQAPPGAWVGPVESVYGLHLLRVDQVELAPPAAEHPYRVLAARESLALREGLVKLRGRYPLEVAVGPP